MVDMSGGEMFFDIPGPSCAARFLSNQKNMLVTFLIVTTVAMY